MEVTRALKDALDALVLRKKMIEKKIHVDNEEIDTLSKKSEEINASKK